PPPPPPFSTPTPAYARLRCLVGSEMCIRHRRARPKRLEAAGFTFRWYDLEEALGDVVQ
ncbi:DUF1731 domain-containing protein, partial [Enterobacter hormaechei]|uniref:DUF1731 domain-containing protein n=1 Tax=Enterobacter hormaechei TaxID=158836 RepID=UPI0039EB7CB9